MKKIPICAGLALLFALCGCSALPLNKEETSNTIPLLETQAENPLQQESPSPQESPPPQENPSPQESPSPSSQAGLENPLEEITPPPHNARDQNPEGDSPMPPIFDLETKTVTLNSGYEMPVYGIGTYSLTGETCISSLTEALNQGVRLIDTAYMYHNEESVGEVVPYIQSLGIAVQGWYPLGGRGYTAELLNDGTITEIAAAHGKTPAQIILRWNLQRSVIVIPGSSNPDHIRENTELFDFELTEEEMERIRALDRGEKHDWY